MRQDSPELALNFTGKNTKLLQSMYDYTIVPSEKIKKRMDFFYTPYNQQFLLRKHMTFDDQVPEVPADQAQAVQKPFVMQSTGLVGIEEKIAEERKRQAETAAADITSGQVDLELSKIPLRDRQFTKEELAKLEKKTWIEIKDLIFETEPQVLEYLSYHC